jgi:hypothetical protein
MTPSPTRPWNPSNWSLFRPWNWSRWFWAAILIAIPPIYFLSAVPVERILIRSSLPPFVQQSVHQVFVPVWHWAHRSKKVARFLAWENGHFNRITGVEFQIGRYFPTIYIDVDRSAPPPAAPPAR